MKKLIASIISIFLYSSIALASNPVSIITGNVEDATGQPVKAGTKVCFQVASLQSFGGSIFAGPPGLKCFNTIAGGNLPGGVTLPQGAFVNVTIGNAQPRQIQVPTQSPVDLWTLIAANSDPPSLVSQIASGNSTCTVINPPNGSIGTATITCSTTGSFPLTANVSSNGFKIQNEGQPTVNGDVLEFGGDATVNNLTVLGTFNFPGGSFGCANGIRCNEINLMDQVGASDSMESLSCTITTPASKQAVCTGLSSSKFAAPQYVAMYGAGPSPSVTAPTVANASPISINISSTADNTHFTNACAVTNPYVWCTASSNVCGISNRSMVTAGQSITINGAGSAGGNLTTTVAAILDFHKIQLGTNALTTVNGVHVTGANCTTSRFYQACAIDANGAWACPNSWTTVANTSSSLNWGNWVDYQVTGEASAIAYVLRNASDSSGTGDHIVDVEVPTQISLLANTNWWDNDLLIYNGPDGGVAKCTPGAVGCSFTTVMLRDVGLGYGYDWNQGGAVSGGSSPTSTYNQTFFSQVASVSGNTVTFTTIPTQSGTFTMVHDIGPPMNSAITASCDATSHKCGKVYVPPCQTTGCGYSEVTPIVAQNGIGQAIECGANFVPGDNSKNGPTGQIGQINYRGTIGGTGLFVFNEAGFDMENCNINGLTTMGVGLDIDETNPFTTVTTTSPTLKRVSIGQSSVGIRLANQNISNVEFGTFEDVYSNVLGGIPNEDTTPVGLGGYGLLDNSGNSLLHQCINCQLWGQIGSWSLAGFDMYGGQSGGPFNYISYYLPSYMPDMMSIMNTRQEYASRIIFSASNAGGYQIQAPSLINNHFTSLEPLEDGILFSFAGGATAKFIGNWFETVTRGIVNNNFADPQLTTPNSLVSPWSSASNGEIASTGNTYAGMSAPFNGNGLTNAHSIADQYYQSNGALTDVPQPTPATPTSLSINSGCASPITLTLAQVSKNAGVCAGISNSGGTVVFNITNTNAAGGIININSNHQLYCVFRMDGTAGSTPPTLVWQNSDVGTMCSNIAHHTGTINYYSNNDGATYTLENNFGGGGSTRVAWGYNNEAW